MKTFNMTKIGKKIATLRKENNMTQVELADRLGISYQAVSNWERGDSMPDIAKLAELSEILGVTIDQLLDNEKQSTVIKQIIKEEPVEIEILTEDELEDLLPLVKPKQFEKSFNDFENIPFEMFIIMAPFLEEAQIDAWVKVKIEQNAEVKWVALAPFMSSRAISETFSALLKKNNHQIGWVAGFAPFVSKETLNQEIVGIYHTHGLSTTIALVPFVSSSKVDELLEIAIKNNKYGDVAAFMPFASGEGGFSKIINQFKNRR